jgi:hypothetical protein
VQADWRWLSCSNRNHVFDSVSETLEQQHSQSLYASRFSFRFPQCVSLRQKVRGIGTDLKSAVVDILGKADSVSPAAKSADDTVRSKLKQLLGF